MNKYEIKNREKQIKNAKRGGYSINPDKVKLNKLQRLVNDLRREADSVDELDLFNLGYKTALLDVAEDLKSVL